MTTDDDPQHLAADAADTIERLLAAIEDGEVTAPSGFVARVQGAQSALRALADQHPEPDHDG